MQIFLASDHRGFSLKNKLVADLTRASLNQSTPVNIVDLGPTTYNPDDDYNDPAIAVSKAVLDAEKTEEAFGILICGSAIGVSIQANRIKGIRAAVVTDIETAIASRDHDDANIICLSADHLANAADPLEGEKAYEDLFATVVKFITTPFSGESRHVRRINRSDAEVK
ncbi:RpiB/LacA/LacB family sugar-phosphate isomerase [Candidatus Saccharibacteria bacterium]|nr:RpiB/LacA/LacB family sugar-phosphate isomerase [Candidatus Saccharibacteria bacterium]